MNTMIRLLLLSLTGCLARSSFTNRLAKSNHQNAIVLRDLSQLASQTQPGPPTAMLAQRAAQAEDTAAQLARSSSAFISPAMMRSLGTTGLNLAGLMSGGGAGGAMLGLLVGYMQRRKRLEAERLCHTLSNEDKTESQRIMKARGLQAG